MKEELLEDVKKLLNTLENPAVHIWSDDTLEASSYRIDNVWDDVIEKIRDALARPDYNEDYSEGYGDGIKEARTIVSNVMLAMAADLRTGGNVSLGVALGAIVEDAMVKVDYALRSHI